jgi:hypothetical protein
VCYTKGHEPCISPFCFTWFGHELGHTKHYLIDMIALEEGCAFVTNHREITGLIPRYGRALSVRGLLQIPYVHLYEWTLLMDFCDQGLEHVPWEVRGDPIAVGDDIQAEICEAFEWIRRCALLTSRGRSLVAWLIELNELACRRWGDVRRQLESTCHSTAHGV